MKKYKMTGCARFIIVLAILAPLAFLGASYYNGSDGIQTIKDLFSSTKEKVEGSRNVSSKDDVKDIQEELDYYKSRNDRLEKDIEQMKKELDAKDDEIKELKSGQ